MPVEFKNLTKSFTCEDASESQRNFVTVLLQGSVGINEVCHMKFVL